MRKLTILAMLLALILLAAACSGVGSPVDGQDYKSITAEEAIELIGTQGVYLIDVRNPEELADGYIEGMANVRLNDLDSGIAEVVPDKNDTVIVYCASGNRSAKAARMLCNAGYKNVYDLGGISAWPYDIVND